MEQNVVLEVKNLNVTINKPAEEEVLLLKDVSFKIFKGQVVGLVGETGSGKTLTMLAIMRMLNKNIKVKSGNIIFMGKDITSNTNRNMKKRYVNGISMIFQNQKLALSPLYKISTQMYDVIKANKNLPRKATKEYCLWLLKKVGFSNPADVYNKYPFELSGGMLQRVILAIAVSMEPNLLIADEPTTALDPDIQNYSLYLIKKFQQKLGNSVILITHDFSVIKKICTNVMVMKNGRIIENGLVEEVLQHPQHVYTKQLIEFSGINSCW